MKPSRPYLIRALYEWIVDNDCTPHILVASEYPNTKVPAGYARDGQIVLNISPNAVRYLDMSNNAISFEGRFGGTPQRLYVPIAAVLAIYARENNQGMFFEEDEFADEPQLPDTPPDDEPPRPSARPALKVVK